MLVLLEDAHWIDPSTRELFDLTVERVRDLPALMVVTFRPEFRPPWAGHGHVRPLSLTRLSRQQGTAMVERVAGGRLLSAEVAAQIVAKSDGVPLFVEELTKTVLDSGLLREEGDRYTLCGPLPPLTIPSTLQDSLLARLDRLAAVREVAQVASVLGREFSFELLAAVAPQDEAALGEAMAQLCAAELVFCRGTPPEATYSFKHALVQDAAYQSLLRSRRQRLHARLAAVLQERFPSTAEAEPELLAHHYAEAGLTAQAVEAWQRAARLSMNRSAPTEALAQLKAALAVLDDLPPGPDRDHRELELRLALGAALISRRGWAAVEVGETYARARNLCTTDAQFPQLLGALSGLLAHHLHAASSKNVALRIASEILSLAEQRQDTPAQAAGHRFVAVTRLFSGEFRLAWTHFEHCLALYHPRDRSNPIYLWGPDVHVTALLFRALILLLQGFPEQAREHGHAALAATYDLRHAYTTCQNLYLTCWLHQVLREAWVVEARAGSLISLAREHGLSAWEASGAVFHGWAVAEGGVTEDGICELRRGLAAKEDMGVLQHTPGMLGMLAELSIDMNHPLRSLALLDEALARVERLEERWFEADLHRLRGETLLASNRPCDAEACFRRALDVARRQEAKWWELRAATSLARLWAERGERQKACDLLAPVYGWFTEGFDTEDLKQAKALLDALA